MKTITETSPLIAINFSASGLKCDAAGCEYRDDSIVTLNPRTISENTNRRCPECGANLLTEADAKALILTRRVILAINVLVLPIMVLLLPFHLLFGVKRKSTELKMNGSGEVAISVMKMGRHESNHREHRDC